MTPIVAGTPQESSGTLLKLYWHLAFVALAVVFQRRLLRVKSGARCGHTNFRSACVDKLDARQPFRTNSDVPGRETQRDFDAVAYAAVAINVTVPEPNSGYILRYSCCSSKQFSCVSKSGFARIWMALELTALEAVWGCSRRQVNREPYFLLTCLLENGISQRNAWKFVCFYSITFL
jgi:hypothetical protein